MSIIILITINVKSVKTNVGNCNARKLRNGVYYLWKGYSVVGDQLHKEHQNSLFENNYVAQ